DQEREGHRQRQRDQPLAREPALGHRHAADDQPELAVVGEREAGDEAGARAEAEAPEEPEEEGALERQQERERERDEDALPGGEPGEADHQEEADQEDVLEGEEGPGQLLGLGVAAEED